MCPGPATERHDPPRLDDELVPGVTAVVDDRAVAGEHAVRERVVAQELPDILLRVQLGALGWQRDDGDVCRKGQPLRDVPSRLVDQQHGMPPGRDPCRNFDQVVVYRFGIAPRHDQPGRLALCRADRAEDVGRGGPLIVRRAGTGAAPGPATGDLVLLPDPGLVAEPDLYVTGIETPAARDCRHDFSKTF